MKIQSTFRNMVIQSFLEWGVFGHFLLGIWDTFQNILRDMGYLGTPLPGSRYVYVMLKSMIIVS